MIDYATLQDRLRWHGQEHLMRYWDVLGDPEREALLGEIGGIDFELMTRLHRDLVKHPSNPEASEAIAPLQGKTWESLGIGERAAIANTGMRALREGKVAALLVAGGQGTRLGYDGPKGSFTLDLPSGKSLFQLQAERLLKLSQLCGKIIPWYIMTSRENHVATTDFFRHHSNFGLSDEQLFFFPQAELPLVDAEGKILLADKGKLALGANGNGGCFPALRESGGFADMRRRGVEWLFVFGVDNALVRVCDPRFLGFTMASGFPAGSKAVAKNSPEERVGVFCRRGGKPSVLEYSEMTPEMCEARAGDNQLLYGSANIAVHLFRLDFLEEQSQANLPYHVALKKIAVVGPEGSPMMPMAPNAYKFELFMFDLFPRAPGMTVLEVIREEEFAPVKNRSGIDSPASARELVLRLHRQWAVAAGFSETELVGLEVEVSPLTSFAGEGLNRTSFHRTGNKNLLLA